MSDFDQKYLPGIREGEELLQFVKRIKAERDEAQKVLLGVREWLRFVQHQFLRESEVKTPTEIVAELDALEWLKDE